MNKYFMFIHLQKYFRNFFFTRGDFNFDWLSFSKLIWWNRTRPIFSKFDQTKMCQVLLYTLSNLFDSINLIKLIWPCISGLRNSQICSLNKLMICAFYTCHVVILSSTTFNLEFFFATLLIKKTLLIIYWLYP